MVMGVPVFWIPAAPNGVFAGWLRRGRMLDGRRDDSAAPVCCVLKGREMVGSSTILPTDNSPGVTPGNRWRRLWRHSRRRGGQHASALGTANRLSIAPELALRYHQGS